MHLFRTLAITAALVVVSPAAHADFFDVVKKVGQVADAANQVAEGRVDAPTAALGAIGGKDGKHGGSHGKHHK